jgi:hypothetical protein
MDVVSSISQIKCELLWKLCRRHGWGAPISEDALLNLALSDTNQATGRAVVGELLQEPYIVFRTDDGYSVKNDPDSQAQAAYRLKSTCGYTEIQIEATLSRFEQAGGFNAYDEDSVLESLDEWS